MLMRAALLAVVSLLALPVAPTGATPPDIVTQAEFAEPTTRYGHGVLGDTPEWGALVLTVDKCSGCEGEIIEAVTIRLPENRVFEDIAPRLIDGDDGVPLVMVVESDLALGARLALYDETGLYAATPFIGQPYRWLAPVGASDMDGDGWPEIAYVDRPHLAKILRVWRLRDGKLQEIATLDGITNHQIGQNFISGGIRNCSDGPEMVVATGDWQTVLAVGLDGSHLAARPLGDFEGTESLNAALVCAD